MLIKERTSSTYYDIYYILDAIHKHGWTRKQKYLDTFSLKKWEKMSIADRKSVVFQNAVLALCNSQRYNTHSMLIPSEDCF